MDISKETYNKFNIPNDLFYEDDSGYLCLNYVQTSCKTEQGISISDLGIPLTIFNSLFREFFILVFMYNNKELFSDKDWSQVISNSSIKKENFNEANVIPYKKMTKSDFIDFVSKFVSSIINCYLQIDDEDLMDTFIHFEISGDPLRHKNGVQLLYNYYMRLFINLVYNKSEKKIINTFYNDLLPIKDISGIEIVKLEEFKNKYNFDINTSGEDNDIYRITMFKLFLNAVVTFHNALKEIAEPISNREGHYSRLASCPCLLNIIDKAGFSVRDNAKVRAEKTIQLLTNYNRNRSNKAIFNIIDNSVPYLINTDFPYYNERMCVNKNAS